MDNPTFRTIRTLIIDDVSDELFWHMNRRNNAMMGYYGDDAHIVAWKLKADFIKSLPDHLKSEYRTIERRVKRSKYHRLEIHPVTLSDRWDKVEMRDTFEEFMTALEKGELYVWHG